LRLGEGTNDSFDASEEIRRSLVKNQSRQWTVVHDPDAQGSFRRKAIEAKRLRAGDSATQLLLNQWSPHLKTILLVDDSRFMRLVNERALIKAGYSVLTASDGEEAVHIATSVIPDIVLLDMLLPKLGGPEVLQALKKNPLTASIPVVVLSSLSQKNEGKLVKDGAAAYFEKSRLESEGTDTLLEMVKDALDCAASIGVRGDLTTPTLAPAALTATPSLLSQGPTVSRPR
jgi:twitching motility two-component system response regulator PilH